MSTVIKVNCNLVIDMGYFTHLGSGLLANPALMENPPLSNTNTFFADIAAHAFLYKMQRQKQTLFDDLLILFE